MKRIFLDANILLDIIFSRETHAEFSRRILSLTGYQKYTSTLNVSNIYYIVQKESDKLEAKKNIGLVIRHCQILDVNSMMIHQAYNSLFETFTDFEDAIQHYCAVAHSMDAIVTRNQKDFTNSEIPVYTPREFVKAFGE